jgi:PadR family transcriptional regulator PadR
MVLPSTTFEEAISKPTISSIISLVLLQQIMLLVEVKGKRQYLDASHRSSAGDAGSAHPLNRCPWPAHGWAISERVQQMSSDVLRIQQGSLYPALHRLERRGLIKAHWGTSDNNRRAKYYELTRTGRRQLEADQKEWEKLTAAIAQVLRPI